VLVSHRERLIEVFERRDDAWQHTEARRGESVRIEALGGELSVDQIYGVATAT
jgi:hypothetical protein